MSRRTLPILLCGTVLVSRHNEPEQLGIRLGMACMAPQTCAQTFIGTSYGVPGVYALSHPLTFDVASDTTAITTLMLT